MFLRVIFRRIMPFPVPIRFRIFYDIVHGGANGQTITFIGFFLRSFSQAQFFQFLVNSVEEEFL